jgi:hypothetical protein
MAESAIKKMYGYNLCGYYLLPLLHLNRFMFGPDNFLNCYLDEKNRYLYVKVKDLFDSEIPYKSTWYETTVSRDSELYFVYRIPFRWESIVLLFRDGRYSEFSESAKETIIRHSDLAYKVQDAKGNVFTDARLLALDRSPVLVRSLADELDVDESVLQGELVSRPKPEEFVTLV